ncbi:MAG: HAD family phosphatase [Elusimicrobia bacterium]|nr:HAD family phosphatase [Elusimicrobiota bacterium]
MKAVIFDMDGVIVDSEKQWKLAEGPFFRRLVPSWTDHDHHKIVGLGVVDLYHWLVDEYAITQPKEEFLKECHALAEDIYGRKVVYTEGVGAFLAMLKRNRVKVGLASSSPREWIDIVLNRFELKHEFGAVASGDETPGKTKPEPDLYLLCAERLGVLPHECVAIEDSAPGLKAAKAAGMFCAAFRNGHNDEQDLEGADYEFSTFEELGTRFKIKPARG